MHVRIAPHRKKAALVLLGLSLCGVTVRVTSQTPPTVVVGAQNAGGGISYAKPANLKVLPKDMTGEQVDILMYRYQADLGVPCGYCHEQDPQTAQINFTSDENPLKATARVMIGMTNDINTKYLAQLGDRRYAEPIICGNCHQGQVTPPTFQPKKAATNH